MQSQSPEEYRESLEAEKAKNRLRADVILETLQEELSSEHQALVAELLTQVLPSLGLNELTLIIGDYFGGTDA